MTTIGEVLRRERLRRNLELAKIASELKISARFLAAIEQEEFGKLPGGVFTKSFVRQYATYLGLDADELAEEVRRMVDPEPAVPAFADKPKPDVPTIPLQFNEDWQSVGERRMPWPSWLTAGVLLVTLMFVCSGVVWWWERPRHQSVAQEQPPAPRVVPPAQSTPAAVPAADAPQATLPVATLESPAPDTHPTAPPAATQTAAPPPPATSGLPVSTSNPNASVRVAITAEEPVWMRALVNGKYQFSGVLQARETRNIDADGQVELRLGNAGGVTVTLNGKSIGPVGPKGQVRTVQFNSGGFQIVSSKPAADALDRL